VPIDGPDDRPDVIPSEIDPDVECVRIGSEVHGGLGAQPPPPAAPDASAEDEPRLCPEGYVPRRRRRPPYDLDRKVVRRDSPPEHRP
jgi:hypothetical protein